MLRYGEPSQHNLVIVLQIWIVLFDSSDPASRDSGRNDEGTTITISQSHYHLVVDSSVLRQLLRKSQGGKGFDLLGLVRRLMS